MASIYGNEDPTNVIEQEFDSEGMPEDGLELRFEVEIGKTYLYRDMEFIGEYDGISGPWGKKALPNGRYIADNLRDRTKSSMTCDVANGEQIGFSIDLDPQFETDRTLLRIHPDGGDYVGTLGCIGINCTDAQRFYDDINDNYRGSFNVFVY